MPRAKSSTLVAACRRLAASLDADMGRANAEPILYGRDKSMWAIELRRLANNLVVTISSLGLIADPDGPRARATVAYAQAKEKWEFLTDKKWTE